MRPEMRAIEARLDRAEVAGGNTTAARLALSELRWRLEYTGDVEAAHASLERLRILAAAPPPAAPPAPATDGSWGPCTEVWFLKLDASVDRMLADGYDDRGRPPRFLDRINDPARLDAYLRGLLVSRPTVDGVDHRKELNFATTGLVRLILRRRPTGYPWHPDLDAVLARFIADWQDPTTGFFGVTYEIDGRWLRTVDLSLTFHMARYLDGRIHHWPQLIDTLLSIREDRYPHGWLDEAGMTSHNNYDVAVLFRLGWPRMRPDQQRNARRELERLTEWCLGTALTPDGRVASRAVAESLPESYYFTIAFLDTVGYFDPEKRFWTDRALPEAPAMAARLERHVRELSPADPMARMALDRLPR